MRAALHLIGTPRQGFRQVVAPKSARWLWAHLKAAFPAAFSLCLMPDHLHLVLPLDTDIGMLRSILAHHGRLFGTAWSLHTEKATTAKIVWRTIRYGFLNPVRAGYVDDPWKWPWSTLRDLGGVIVEPWTTDGVRRVALVPGGRILASLTTWDGRTPPVPARVDAENLPVAPLPAIAAATASALRLQPGDVSHRGPARDLFVHTALACNPIELGRLAEACNVSARTIQRIRNKETPPGLGSALRCLQDPRLLIYDVEGETPRTPHRRKPAEVA